MAKWYGIIGYAQTVEVEPGIWDTDNYVERNYYGETIRNWSRNLKSINKVNDDIILSNSISIIADPYANENFCDMRYVEYMGVKWKVENVEVQYPRLILTLGGKWNGDET